MPADWNLLRPTRRALPLLLLSALAAATQQPAITWDRHVDEGLTYRMEVLTAPPRLAHGIRIDPNVFEMRTWLPGGSIYDATPTNGRATVSQIAAQAKATAAINGDFFQFGTDPGGDPEGLMIQDGELLSHPGRTGNRFAAVGWGPGVPFRLMQPTWEGRITGKDGLELKIDQWNGRVDENQIGFSTSRAAFVYASVPSTAIRLSVPNGPIKPGDIVSAKVEEVHPLTGRMPIPPGQAFLVGAGEAAKRLEGLVPGDELTVSAGVRGRLQGIREAIGGGPVLLRNGNPVVRESDFATARHPRSAIGATRDGRIWLVLVDGRQPMSAGITLPELAELMRRWGCVDAINLDGGGSSAMHLMGVTVNRPSGGVERLVANGIVLTARQPKESAESATALEIDAPASLHVGEEAVVSLKHEGVQRPSSDVVLAAHGSVWIDQSGRLRAISEGKGSVTALFRGALARKEVTVLKAR